MNVDADKLGQTDLSNSSGAKVNKTIGIAGHEGIYNASSVDEIIVVDSDEIMLQPALTTLQKFYRTTLVRELDDLDLERQVNERALFLIDPNAFDRRALSVYQQLLKQGANVIVAVFPDESIVAEADCLEEGALDFITKPISPGTIAFYVRRRMEFVRRVTSRGKATKDFIAIRKNMPTLPRAWRIDLVEDSHVDARSLCELLSNNCDIRWFNCAEVFLERDQTLKPDLFILDLFLSGREEGFELLRGIKENSFYKDVSVLLLTGSWQRRRVEAGLNLGADDYIKKLGLNDDAIRARIHTNLAMSLMSRSDLRNGLQG